MARDHGVQGRSGKRSIRSTNGRSPDPVMVDSIGAAYRSRLDEDVHVQLPERISDLLRALKRAETGR